VAARRRPRPPEEADHGSERWLVTYADMVTLLMVLFIVMFSMSQVDQEKYSALKAGLSEGFGGAKTPLQGAAVLDETATGNLTPVQPALREVAVDELEELVSSPLSEDERAALRQEAERLEHLRRAIDAALRREGLRDDVRLSYDERGLVIALISRHVTFGNDVATLSPRGIRVVDTVAPVLAAIADPIQVDGHTNQVDVKPAYFETDWDLSSARAVTVLRRLHEHGRISADRLSAAAFGHERPLLDPRDPEAPEVNKRVDIVIVSPVPAAARALTAADGEHPTDGARG
jgi:chemotaxis protein MotB